MSTQKAIGLVILTFLAFIQLSKQLGGDRNQVILAMYMGYNCISVNDFNTGITFVAMNIYPFFLKCQNKSSTKSHLKI